MNALPLLVSFSSLPVFLEALPARTREECKEEIEALVEKGYPPVVSFHTVSTLFGISVEFVGSLSNSPQHYYRRFKIKKGKKIREIQAPRVALKVLQRWIGFHLSRALKMGDEVFGFVPGKSVFDAAWRHRQAKWVYSLDLKDFFPSISSARVKHALKGIGYSENAAQLTVQLCTLDGRLPQGSPASPVLSNLVFSATDEKLRNLARSEGIRYSRYADDLVFSGTEEMPSALPETLKKILCGDGWEIAAEKEHLAVAPARLKIHGLLVHGDAPRLTKGYRNRIRAFKHLLSNGKIREKDLNKVRGHIAYAHFVENSKTDQE